MLLMLDNPKSFGEDLISNTLLSSVNINSAFLFEIKDLLDFLQ